jgi:SAM-dependent methyltransferase
MVPDHGSEEREEAGVQEAPGDSSPRSRGREAEGAWPCPLCGGETARIFQRDGYWIRGCAACGHRSAEVSPGDSFTEDVYGDEYFLGGGPGYPDYLREASILRARGRRYARLLGRHMAPGVMLDVGAAAGFVLQGFLDEGWRGEGVEPNPRMARHAREELGLDVAAATLEDLTFDSAFDLVTLIQVIAHFPKPRKAIAVVAEALRPGGYCLVETWDRASLTARLLGRHWHEYSPPSVLHWFSREGVRSLLGERGLEPVARGRPFRVIQGRHAKSLLAYKTAGVGGMGLLGKAAALVPDRLPIPYPSEDLFWMLFRKPA